MPKPEILAATAWRNNAEMIVAARDLGYITGAVLDCTYGEGAWWTVWTPHDFCATDLIGAKSPSAGKGVDFRKQPWKDGIFDTVCFDPPYKLNGTPSEPDEPYGVDVVATRQERHQLIREGMTECVRLLAPGGHLLMKCKDQVSSGHVRWQTYEFVAHGQSLGLDLVDSLLFLAYRKQPGRQVHARRNYSTLLIFQRLPIPRKTSAGVAKVKTGRPAVDAGRSTVRARRRRLVKVSHRSGSS